MTEFDLTYLLLIPIGMIAGYLNVMAGGGSLLTVPAMIFLGMEGSVANGTNRIAILAQNISAVSAFYKKGFSNFKLSLSLAACAIPGAIAGAWVGTLIRGESFNLLLVATMLLVMVLMYGGKQKAKPVFNLTEHQRIWWGHILMVGVGFYGGVIQIGVGFILMAVLYRVMNIDLIRVNMHKVFIVLCFTTVSLIVYASRLDLIWIAGLSLAIGNSIGGWFGAHVSVVKGESAIKIVLNIALVMMIIKLLFY